ncbi:2Fe-2S ferredoxin [Paenibacillus endophyticus]|uniref:2Fe-2S ferredoxin n=1 Tax=Paenibacillus endophyticus TaxID=1294268 RepID=A0A7W5CB07_9BACL|nr:2Fe-2S iron-sulfur cluster-binding protein [Paenibacillus endophyticus]MBB3154400.1 2Fe-2S ferredoxin [Paenibacillus endophyticus]
MIELKGRTKTAVVEAEVGLSLLDLAMKHDVDWSFSCARGTCARCRCLVTEGADQLEGITDEEWDRLEPEEFDEGYRLGCQAIIKTADANISAANKPYF